MVVYTCRYKVDYLETLRSSTENYERFKLDHFTAIKRSVYKWLGEEADVDVFVQWVYQKVGIHHHLLKKLKNPEKYFDIIVQNMIEEYVFGEDHGQDLETLNLYSPNAHHKYFQDLFDNVDQSTLLTHQQKLIVGLRLQGCSLVEIAETLNIHPRIIKKRMEKAFKTIR